SPVTRDSFGARRHLWLLGARRDGAPTMLACALWSRRANAWTPDEGHHQCLKPPHTLFRIEYRAPHLADRRSRYSAVLSPPAVELTRPRVNGALRPPAHGLTLTEGTAFPLGTRSASLRTTLSD